MMTPNAQENAPRIWSLYQSKVFDTLRHGTGNVIIEAGPGSGKTTTIVEGVKYARGSVLMLAFNKSIATELQARAPRHVDVRTLHSAGLLAVKSAFGRDVRIEENKTWDIAAEVLIARGLYMTNRDGDKRALGLPKVSKLVGYAKNTLAERTVDALESLAIDLGLDDEPEIDPRDMAEAAVEILDLCQSTTHVIDFDDMIWFPAVHGLRPSKYDMVVVDETQDLNAAQIYLIKALVRRGGRIIAVGDEFQAIYGFRGADSQAMTRMKSELSAEVLPLSVSYRCAASIVREAQKISSKIEAAPNAPEGQVVEIDETVAEPANASTARPRPGDFVLSRTNAPLLGLCLRYLAAGIPACIAGRDIGKTLLTYVDKARTDSVEVLLTWIANWRAVEVKRAEKLDKPAKAEFTNDIAASIEILAEGETRVSAIRAKIERLFSDADPKARVVFSTVHKAKGLERSRVFLISKTFRPSRSQEERNIYYVAVTRAIDALIFIGPRPAI